MTAPDVRFDLVLTVETPAAPLRSHRIMFGLDAANAAFQLQKLAEHGRELGWRVEQRWDGVVIRDSDSGETEYYDVELDDPRDRLIAAEHLLPATLAARWPSAGFDVTQDPARTQTLRIAWLDGPPAAAVGAFTAQHSLKAFHREREDVVLERRNSMQAWSDVIVVVESTYGVRVPRDREGVISWVRAAKRTVDVPVTAVGEGQDGNDVECIRYTLAELLNTHVASTDFGYLAPPPADP